MAKGPYRAEFGAIHFEGQPGFLFTVTPDDAAPQVASALNIAHWQVNAPTFEEAWAKTGYQYGDDALENVRLGFSLARFNG